MADGISKLENMDSTVSTSSSIREFELFQQFCSNTSPTDWEIPAESCEAIDSWETRGGGTAISIAAGADDLTLASYSTRCSGPRSPLTSPSSATGHREIPAAGSVRVDKYEAVVVSTTAGAECRQRRRLWSQRRSHNHDTDASSSSTTPKYPATGSGPDPDESGRLMDSDICRQNTDDLGESRQLNDLNQSITSPMATSSRNGTIVCRVKLLDGEEFTADVERKSTGQVLFDRVCKHLNLLERDYFACSYCDVGNVKMWLRNDKKIVDQITDDSPFLFQFQVKFYPPDISALQEDITRYQFCLQIQTDVASGSLPCSFLTYALLGSYLAQSVLGDHNLVAGRVTNCGRNRDSQPDAVGYLRHISFAPNQSDELLDKIAELHHNHRGLAPADAELEYLINASRLAMYGVDNHPVLDYGGEPACVGVYSSGLLIYRDRLRVRRLSWVSIIQVSYKRSNFCVNVRSAESEAGTPVNDSCNGSSSVIKFKLASKQLAKRLWRSAVENHMFFRLKESVAIDSGILSRFLGSHFRFSGRTQQQVKRDAMVVGRRPQLAGPQRRTTPQHATPSSLNHTVSNADTQAATCDVTETPTRADNFRPTVDRISMAPLAADVDFQQRDSVCPSTCVVTAEVINSDSPTVAHTSAPTTMCPAMARFSPVPSASSVGGVSLSSQHATPSRCSSEMTSSTVRTVSRRVTATAATVANGDKMAAVTVDPLVDYCSLISAHSHTSRTHTVETITYQSGNDGVMVEKKLLINTQGSEDPDKVLAEAIQSVTAMDNEIEVQKIDIQTTTELELD